jgi:pilus assembly protein Flp/PilA
MGVLASAGALQGLTRPQGFISFVQPQERSSMKKLTASLSRFWRDESGASAVEYGLLTALIAAVIVGTVATLGTTLDTAFQAVVTALT